VRDQFERWAGGHHAAVVAEEPRPRGEHLVVVAARESLVIGVP
jgi:hypothetical protein